MSYFLSMSCVGWMVTCMVVTVILATYMVVVIANSARRKNECARCRRVLGYGDDDDE